MTPSPRDSSNCISLNKQITIIIMNKQYYIGLDVHKETIAIAYTHAHSRSKHSIHDQNCLIMLKREVTTKLQKALVNSSTGHGLGTMPCSVFRYTLSTSSHLTKRVPRPQMHSKSFSIISKGSTPEVSR